MVHTPFHSHAHSLASVLLHTGRIFRNTRTLNSISVLRQKRGTEQRLGSDGYRQQSLLDGSGKLWVFPAPAPPWRSGRERSDTPTAGCVMLGNLRHRCRKLTTAQA